MISENGTKYVSSRFGSRKITKTTILTLSIVVVAYLLMSSYFVFTHRGIRLNGDYEVQYTTSIPQQTNYTEFHESYLSTHSAVILNLTPFTGNTYYSIPRFDYDLIVFNLTLEPRDPTRAKEVEFRIADEYPPLAIITQMISNKTTLSYQTDFNTVKNKSEQWLVSTRISVSPIDDFICHSLIVWANSSVPLCPVSVDIQSTSGLSLFENNMMKKMRSTSPIIVSTKDNSSSYGSYFWPNQVNETFYLRPGNLSGSCYWGRFSYAAVDFNVTFFENERIHLVFHLKAVEVELFFDTAYPINQLSWDCGTYEEIYFLYYSPSSAPTSLYVPPDDLHIFSSILKASDIRMHFSPSRVVASIDDYIQINGSHNVQIHVAFKSALEIATVWDTTIIILTLVLFFLSIGRLGLLINDFQTKPKKKIRLDFRIIPSILFMILGFIPWYSSTLMYDTSWVGDFTVYNIPFASIPLVGIWTEGSNLILTIPEYVLGWSLLSITLYWLPLIWSLIRYRTPSNYDDDIQMGLTLLIPGCFPYLIQLYYFEYAANMRYIDQVLFNYSIIPWICLSIPVVWLLLAVVRQVKGSYSYGDDSNELESDFVISQEEEQKKSKIREKSSINLQNSIFVFFVAFFFSGLIPCLVGYRFEYYYPGTFSTYYIQPIQWTSYLFGFNPYYSTLNLGALLVGVPYTAFTALSLVWLFERINHQRSMIWVILGSLISMASMIPGLFVLNWLGELQSTVTSLWFTYAPLPLMSFIVLGISLLVWLKDLDAKDWQGITVFSKNSD